MKFRQAVSTDLTAIEAIYDRVLTRKEAGQEHIGWVRGLYPTRATASQSLQRQDLYVMESEGQILAVATINQIQADVYSTAPWRYMAPDHKVLVLHTLVVDPNSIRNGLGRQFVTFYEDMGRQLGCTCLRLDTNVENSNARAFYNALGYEELCTRPCTFPGITGLTWILMEKKL